MYRKMIPGIVLSALALQSSAGFLYSAGKFTIERDYGTMEETGTTPHTATTDCSPSMLSYFHKRYLYSGQTALLNLHYRGITTVRAADKRHKGSFYIGMNYAPCIVRRQMEYSEVPDFPFFEVGSAALVSLTFFSRIGHHVGFSIRITRRDKPT